MRTTALFPATLFATIVLASLIACSNEEALLAQLPQEPLTKSQPYRSGENRVKMKRHKITTERALLIAQEAKGLFADENERQIRTRSVGTTLAPIAITNHSKARSASTADTLLFIVNYSNNTGFVFVSNDDRDGEILMYAGNGNFAMQDTTGNPGLKLHVEMMIAYQEHKLNEIKAAEARGEEYTGSMTTETLNEEFAPNDVMPAGVPSGMPGMPGHTCNITGMPGSATRKDICAPATYVEKDWFGDDDAIDLAQNKYRNQKCFGVPTSPPNIPFMTTGGDHGFIGQGENVSTCASAPYCAPPLWNYKEYYIYYGCRMSMLYKSTRREDTIISPFLTTYWDQDQPLRVNYDKNFAGCGPLAIMQVMAYYSHPKGYGSKAFGGTHNTELDKLRNLRTNADIESSPYRHDARKLIAEIGVRGDVTYNKDGTTSISNTNDLKKVRETFESFGYFIGYGGKWEYYNDQNFWTVVQSIKNRQPVYLAGNPKNGSGHVWLLDGYRVIIYNYFYADYYFDEYGKFNAENKYVTSSLPQEYVHGNMGWGEQEPTDYWVARGVYVFGDTNYNKDIDFIAGIRPNQ